MDSMETATAYNQHSDRARRKNRSFTNLKHLSLAPLTVRLPLEDSEDLGDASGSTQSTSYLQGKSAPTTPRLLTHSPAGPRSQSRSRAHRRTGSAPGVPISKSKSATHLRGKSAGFGTVTPKKKKDDSLERSDSDWLLRAGAVMSNEARDFKGQNWLLSRQSSTSLVGIRDAEAEAFEAELAREREAASRRTSRRGSAAMDSDGSPAGSRLASRSASRSQSMAGLRSAAILSPDHGDSYFPDQDEITGPDFVNLDSKLEELEQDTEQDDDAMVRRLVRKGQSGKGSWISSMVGLSLFRVEENEEDSDDDEDVEEAIHEKSSVGRSSWSARHFEGVSNFPEDRVPPPKANEGGWQDAAWLMSLAAKVIL